MLRLPETKPKDWEIKNKRNFGGDSRRGEPPARRKKLISRSKKLRDANQQTKVVEAEPKISTRLKVLNLNNSITNEDLNVLFSNIGTLTGWKREYDEFGRPLGSAVVSFEEAKDAKKAYEEYNGGELDGNVLVINYLPSNSNKSKGRKISQPSKLTVVNEGGKKVIMKV